MTAIEVGQVWRRKSDGTLVEVRSANHEPAVGWSIAVWKRLDNRGTGGLDFGTFAHRYEFVPDLTEPKERDL